MHHKSNPTNCSPHSHSHSRSARPNARPITKVRKRGVSNFGTLRPFDSQPRRHDCLGLFAKSRTVVAQLARRAARPRARATASHA